MDSSEKIKILVLDDEPIVTKRLKPILERKGYYVETFLKSIDALDRFRKHPFDLIITDLKMEGIDGMELLSEVKSMRPETEVIVITGFATMQTAKESFRKGVLDFIAKPFTFGELLAAIDKAVLHINNKESQ
ncbi:response regulator [Desulforhopalus singaporensis]|uniref:Response regulator receiver domain-containing protein n=1 Tax=Desulforhopalus singaporensis TaxID=91360 RepID=A0A1H0KK38_9BACT|nr:response regulator [Desulforhopalus singaporensis]SDO56166.1 Response regulator receiver domain-containing protein [Desulforhopalus singaporensis]